jgi:hypothetical protein
MVTICASDSNRLKDANFSIDVPTPIVAPVSKRPAADRIINDEIFRMVLADTNTNYTLSASVNNGVVTLDVASTNRLELQRMVNDIWQLRDVEQVKNQRGVDMASTLPAITMVPWLAQERRLKFCTSSSSFCSEYDRCMSKGAIWGLHPIEFSKIIAYIENELWKTTNGKNLQMRKREQIGKIPPNHRPVKCQNGPIFITWTLEALTDMTWNIGFERNKI